MDENLNTETPETPQYSEIEQKAMEMGWKPKENFAGEDEDFIDAKEFVRRKPLFDRIEQQSKTLKSLQKAMDSFKEHYSKVEEAAVAKAIESLKQQRKTALSDGDGEQFELLDDEIKKAENQLVEIEKIKTIPVASEESNPAWDNFLARNPWYKETSYMKAFADDLGLRLAKQGLSPEEVLHRVEQDTKKEFPHKFTNPRKQGAPDVETSKNTGGKKTSNDEGLLTDVEKKIMNDLVRSGVITKEKYLADLKLVKQRN